MGEKGFTEPWATRRGGQVALGLAWAQGMNRTRVFSVRFRCLPVPGLIEHSFPGCLVQGMTPHQSWIWELST